MFVFIKHNIHTRYMSNAKIIFVGYVPDINSGGNSMIPYIIKQFNKVFNENTVFFYMLFCRTFDSDNELYIEMNKYNDTNLPIASKEMIDNKENIVIYPENCGNPLNFTKIVRFNFYFNTYVPSVDNEYNIFFASPFHKLYNKVRNNMPSKVQTVIPLQNTNTFHKYINSFYNLNYLLDKCKDYKRERSGSCYTIRKGTLHPHFRNKFDYHPANSFSIEHHMSNCDDLLDIFNKYTYFYSYDGFTNLVQIASLCGCIPIIVPFWEFTSLSEIWDEKWFTNGIAYGDSKEQIEFAINTRPILIEELIKLNDNDATCNLFKELTESIYTYFTVDPDKTS